MFSVVCFLRSAVEVLHCLPRRADFLPSFCSMARRRQDGCSGDATPPACAVLCPLQDGLVCWPWNLAPHGYFSDAGGLERPGKSKWEERQELKDKKWESGNSLNPEDPIVARPQLLSRWLREPRWQDGPAPAAVSPLPSLQFVFCFQYQRV